MKVLYAARLARWDALRAVNHLACFFIKWTTECDRKLHRLVSYLNETKNVKMIGWVADDLKGISLHDPASLIPATVGRSPSGAASTIDWQGTSGTSYFASMT